MASEHTVSTILHDAADKYLARSTAERERSMKYYSLKNKYSCSAISTALRRSTLTYEQRVDLQKQINFGLVAMDCSICSTSLFMEHNDPNNWLEVNSDVQGMRYMWLKWAALMAEEQGL